MFCFIKLSPVSHANEERKILIVTVTSLMPLTVSVRVFPLLEGLSSRYRGMMEMLQPEPSQEASSQRTTKAV